MAGPIPHGNGESENRVYTGARGRSHRLAMKEWVAVSVKRFVLASHGRYLCPGYVEKRTHVV